MHARNINIIFLNKKVVKILKKIAVKKSALPVELCHIIGTFQTNSRQINTERVGPCWNEFPQASPAALTRSAHPRFEHSELEYYRGVPKKTGVGELR